MFLSCILSYLPYAAVTAFTPGPNNLVALYAVGQSGWRKGRAAILGIGAGFLTVMLLCALFCYELAKYIPTAADILKYVGAAYILYLAVHVARGGSGEGDGRTVSFSGGALLQFVNVKIILYAITAFTGYVIPVSGELPFLLAHAVCFTLIGMSGVLTWAAAGGFLQGFLSRHNRPFNLAMGAVLAVCAVKLLL